MAEYDSIAEDYKKSKFAPWRVAVEAHSLFHVLGDVSGMSVLDLACGDGIYSRRLHERGASRVTGVDLSEHMIELARTEESIRPLGIDYHTCAAQELDLNEAFDVVFAAYLLNYARNLDELASFASAVARHLKPGGRFVGINNNPYQQPHHYHHTRPFGFIKSIPTAIPLENGTPITYTFFQENITFHFDNYHLDHDVYAPILAEAGLHDLQWHPLQIDHSLIPEEQRLLEWNGFLDYPPVLCFSAVRS
jgi:ubiquinone/menaquinone biosynthesis C-methylase UbiE